MKDKKPPLLKTLGTLLAWAFLLTLPAAVFAADVYPSRMVRLIVPFAPGGANEFASRLIASELSERLGKQVIVDNRPGGGTVIGTEMVANAAPDGYTLLFTNAFTATPAIHKKLPYDPLKSFIPIAKVGSTPYIIVVHASVPAHSLKELIALAKQKPGQLIFGGGGTGSNQHLAIELFKIMARIDFKIVQFKGGGPQFIDLLGGHSHVGFQSIGTALPQVKSGKIRILATGGKKRAINLPDVPTVAEAGVPGYESTTWWGVYAPAGTPAPIVDRLNKELKTILASEEVKKRFRTFDAEVDYLPLAEFGAFLKEDMEKWARVVKMASIKLEE